MLENEEWEDDSGSEAPRVGSTETIEAVRRHRPRYARIVKDEDEGLRLLADEQGWIGVDLETSGLSPWKDKIAIVSLYSPTAKLPIVLHVRGEMSPRLKAFLSHPSRRFVAHNSACFDALFLANNGVKVTGEAGVDCAQWYDTLIGEQCSLSTGRRDVRVSLKDTLKRHTGKVIEKGHGADSWMAPVLTQAQWDYCAEDIIFLPRLREAQLRKIGEGTRQMEALHFEMERLMPIIIEMEMHGMPFDYSKLDEYRHTQMVRQIEAQETVDRIFGQIQVNKPKPPRPEGARRSSRVPKPFIPLYSSVKINSPIQIRQKFRELFGQELESTDFESLQALGEHPGEVGEVARALVTLRGATKRMSMFSEEWCRDHVNDGWVNAKYRQLGTDTGRLSSREPNYQQTPKDARQLYGGLEGYKIVSADYHALEVYTAAALANDVALIADLQTSDIHSTVAAKLFKIPLEAVSKDQRQLAKAAVFTLLFAGSATGLVRYAKMFGSTLSKEDAQEIVKTFFDNYKQIGFVKNRAYAASGMRALPLDLPTGLRRVLTPFNGSISPSQIVNTMVQGTAAAGMKHAMVKMKERGLSCYLGATVHDELISIVPNREAEEYSHELTRAMVDGMAEVIDLPVRAEALIGTHWGK